MMSPCASHIAARDLSAIGSGSRSSGQGRPAWPSSVMSAISSMSVEMSKELPSPRAWILALSMRANKSPCVARMCMMGSSMSGLAPL